mgnify:FL=1
MSGEALTADAPTPQYIDTLVDNSSVTPQEYRFTVSADNVSCNDGTNDITLSTYLRYLQEYANQGVRIDTRFKPMPEDTSPTP